MKSEDLSALNAMPFLFWAKNEEGVYIWGNNTINEFGGGSIIGKTDYELPWADTADALIEHDNMVLAGDEPSYSHELVHQSAKGEATLNVCKFSGDLDGVRCTFGASFVIDE